MKHFLAISTFDFSDEAAMPMITIDDVRAEMMSRRCRWNDASPDDLDYHFEDEILMPFSRLLALIDWLEYFAARNISIDVAAIEPMMYLWWWAAVASREGLFSMMPKYFHEDYFYAADVPADYFAGASRSDDAFLLFDLPYAVPAEMRGWLISR